MILELMQKRRSCRKFKFNIPPKDILIKLIEAAIWAPSAGNSQPWRFIITQNRDVIKKAAQITNEQRTKVMKKIRPEFKADFEAYSENFINFKQAPVLIVPVYRPPKPFMEIEMSDDSIDFEHIHLHSTLMSISCAIQNLLLMAQDCGLGACCMTGPLICGNRLDPCFHIPNGWHIAAIIPVGYPDELPQKVGRKPVQQVIRWI